jgi:hypothetical protein
MDAVTDIARYDGDRDPGIRLARCGRVGNVRGTGRAAAAAAASGDHRKTGKNEEGSKVRHHFLFTRFTVTP